MCHVLIIESDPRVAKDFAALIADEGCSVASTLTLLGARTEIARHVPSFVLVEARLLEGADNLALEELRGLAHGAEFVFTGEEVATIPPTSFSTLSASRSGELGQPLNAQGLRAAFSRLKRSALHLTDQRASVSQRKEPSEIGHAQGSKDIPELVGAFDLGRTDAFHKTLESEGHFGSLWGRSNVMRHVYQQIIRVSATGVPVFLLGESGSGKELAARMVHDLSARSAFAFLAVNCGAVSSNIIESELFGHEKGSFTGAERQHQGFFERASGGTLFLDEITEMPLDLQVKLLRVLESGTFMRVGSTQVQQSNVRLVAATNRHPSQALEQGKLREDLLYRLNVFPIEMPALRDRTEDITLLADHFLDDICKREGQIKRFSREALEELFRYDWPGNVRELRNIVQRAYVMASSELIENACVPSMRSNPPSLPADIDAPAGAPKITIEIGTTLADVERMVTLATLAYYSRQKERTAAALGVSLKTLYNRLKRYSDDAKTQESVFALPPELADSPQTPAA